MSDTQFALVFVMLLLLLGLAADTGDQVDSMAQDLKAIRKEAQALHGDIDATYRCLCETPLETR